jgi:uncharacterized membrane protein (UPF0127 family)
MKRWSSTLILTAAVGVIVGCQRSGGNAATPTNAPPRQFHLNQAQPKLPVLKLWVGQQEIAAEVARRTTEIATGMMFRTNLAETEGMLFVFSEPFRASFYMRNTQVPLTAAYLAPDGAILELHDLKPFDETPVPATSDRVQFVLEMPQGWFQRHQISTGAVFRTPYGGFPEVNWATLQPRAPRSP